jgi:hypothetical protein
MTEHPLSNHEAMPEVSKQVDTFRNEHGLTGEVSLEVTRRVDHAKDMLGEIVNASPGEPVDVVIAEFIDHTIASDSAPEDVRSAVAVGVEEIYEYPSESPRTADELGEAPLTELGAAMRDLGEVKGDEAVEMVVKAIESAQDSASSAQTELITPEVMQRQIAAIKRQSELEEPIRQQRAEVRKREINQWQRTEKIKTWKSRMKKTIAVTALLATVKGGGLIDMAADPFIDAGSLAASAIPAQSREAPPDKIDGVKFEDFPKDAQEEIIAENVESFESANKAKETVVGLFSRIDKEGYEGVVHDAHEWKLAHKDLFVDNEKIDQATQSIDQSKSNSETLKALSDFMSFYDIEAGFSIDDFAEEVSFNDSQSEVKDIAKAYIKVFSSLPKDFIALSQLERVSVTDEFDTSVTSDFVGQQMGVYSPGDNQITIKTMSKSMKYSKYFDEVITGSKADYESFIAHELSHAFDEHDVVSVDFDEGQQLGEGMAAPLFEQTTRNIIDRPESPSIYAKSSGEEFTAEVGAGLLSDVQGSGGLAAVEQVRQFSSASNKAMIRALSSMEAHYPGIALQIIANRVTN